MLDGGVDGHDEAAVEANFYICGICWRGCDTCGQVQPNCNVRTLRAARCACSLLLARDGLFLLAKRQLYFSPGWEVMHLVPRDSIHQKQMPVLQAMHRTAHIDAERTYESSVRKSNFTLPFFTEVRIGRAQEVVHSVSLGQIRGHSPGF